MGKKIGAGVVVIVVLFMSAVFGLQTVTSAGAARSCSAGELTYLVKGGDTLGAIASRYGTQWPQLASHNRLVNPHLIFIGQRICIPGKGVRYRPPQAPIQVPLRGSSVENMIRQVFGPYADAAIRVARCESGLNPDATNPLSIGGSHASGVFQILYPSTWRGTSQAAKSPYNAWSNIVAAHEIFVRDGYSWREWVCKP
jgi:LysM repeat protein